MIYAAVFVLGMGLGAAIAELMRRRSGRIKQSAGLPIVKIEAVAFGVAEALGATLPEGRRRKLMAEAAQIRIDMSGTEGFSIHQNGLLVVVAAAYGWERRLGLAVAHALHHRLYRHPDPERKNRAWFEAALAGPS